MSKRDPFPYFIMVLLVDKTVLSFVMLFMQCSTRQKSVCIGMHVDNFSKYDLFHANPIRLLNIICSGMLFMRKNFLRFESY